MFADLWQITAEHVLSFAFGVFIGLAISSRYRIVKRKDE